MNLKASPINTDTIMEDMDINTEDVDLDPVLILDQDLDLDLRC